MEGDVFVAEGKLEVGPSENYFVFLDGEWLGRLLLDHFGVRPERGRYDEVGRVRITVERIQDQQG